MNLKRELEWVESVLGKEYKVTREGSEGGRVLVEDMRREMGDLLQRELNRYDLESIGNEAVNREGRFSRRVSSYVYKNFGIKLDAKKVEALGNLAARNTVIDAQNIVKLDRDLWTPGDFGDGESCFFQSRRSAPKLIFRYGGAAVKLYTGEGTPQARAWLVPHYGQAVIFNPYTVRGVRTYDPQGVGRVLVGTGAPFAGHKLKATYNLQNQDRTNGTVWINNGNGVLVLGKGITEFTLYDNTIDLRIKQGPTCVRCGELTDPPLLTYGGSAFCVECYPIKACATCDFHMEVDHMMVSENDSGETSHYCPACYSARMRKCKCGAMHPRHVMRYGGDATWTCLRCVKRDEDARRNATSFVFNSTNASNLTLTLGPFANPQRRQRIAEEMQIRADAQVARATLAQANEELAQQMARTQGPQGGTYRPHPPYTETGLRPRDPANEAQEAARDWQATQEAQDAALAHVMARRMGALIAGLPPRDDTRRLEMITQEGDTLRDMRRQSWVNTSEIIEGLIPRTWTTYRPGDRIHGAFTPADEIDNGDEEDIAF